MTADTITRFKSELNTFFGLVLLNMAFGALSMAFGMIFIITAVLGITESRIPPLLRVPAGSFAMICFGLGLMWVLSGAKVLKGIKGVRTEYRSHPERVSGETLTGWIVRLMARYRENKKTIRWMMFICALGGCSFLALGILNVIQGIGGLALYGDRWTRVLPFVAAGINLTIGLVSLLFCRYFRWYSAAWDLRLEEASRSEAALRHSMEQR